MSIYMGRLVVAVATLGVVAALGMWQNHSHVCNRHVLSHVAPHDLCLSTVSRIHSGAPDGIKPIVSHFLGLDKRAYSLGNASPK